MTTLLIKFGKFYSVKLSSRGEWVRGSKKAKNILRLFVNDPYGGINKQGRWSLMRMRIDHNRTKIDPKLRGL